MHTRNDVYVMEMKVKRTKEGQVAVISQDSETVFRRMGPDLI